MNKKDEQSIQKYRKEFEDDVTTFNEFEANDFIKLLKNNHLLDEAIEVSKTFLSQKPELKDYINQYGYTLYNKFINIKDEEIANKESLFFDILEEITTLCKQGQYSPYEPTINRAIKYALQKTPIDYELILKMYDYLDPQYMSDTPFTNSEGKEFESRKERYYRLKIRALYETKRYKECIETANEALSAPLKWHFNTIYWIKYYRGCSLVERGQFDEANNEFLSLHNRIRGINFYEVLYTMNHNRGEDHLANAYLLYEFFECGYSINHLPLYYRLKEVTDRTNNDILINAVDSFIKALCNEFNKECSLSISEKAKDKSSSDLYDDMYEIIMRHLDLYVERKKARVLSYNDNKKIGNIGINRQSSIFFRQADYIYDDDVYVRDYVEYTPFPSYDSKKECMTTRAILICEAQEDFPDFHY